MGLQLFLELPSGTPILKCLVRRGKNDLLDTMTAGKIQMLGTLMQCHCVLSRFDFLPVCASKIKWALVILSNLSMKTMW